MSPGQPLPRQQRYEASRARDEQANAAWVRRRFGGSVGRSVVRELPWLVVLALFGLVTLGWEAAVANVVLLLSVVLALRAWARRRYGIDGDRPGDGDPGSDRPVAGTG